MFILYHVYYLYYTYAYLYFINLNFISDSNGPTRYERQIPNYVWSNIIEKYPFLTTTL